MTRILIYTAYGWLVFAGLMHLLADVVLQYIRKVRIPGAETALYYGLNTAYGFSLIAYGAFALLVAGYGISILGKLPVILLSFFAALLWLSFCFFFIEYREPKIMILIYIVLLAAAVTAQKISL